MASVTAITFIRKDSQRLPGKSIKTLGKTSLCNYSLETMSKVPSLNDVIVYSSDKEINDHIDPSLGVRFVQRPEKFNKNSATFSIIMDKAIGLIDTEYVLYFCVTSPFIKVETIADMIDKVQNCNYDSAIAVKKIKNFCWFDSSPLNYDPHNVPFTQDLQPVFEETSGLYLFKKDLYLKTKRRCGFNPYLKVVNDVEGHDIDYEEDFNLAKFYLENDLI
ncbi:HAD family hydrolase [archaeon]|nr:HAD family hydrolase [archaeon]